MIIRQATSKDLPTIISIEKECFPLSEAASSQSFYERFEVFPECFLVAEVDSQVVGFINGCITNQPYLPDELYHQATLHDPNGAYQTVFGLDVLPRYQHQGIASALMEQLIILSKNRHLKGMVLTCKDHLIHYYERFGYQHQGVSDSKHGGATWNDMLLLFDKEDIS